MMRYNMYSRKTWITNNWHIFSKYIPMKVFDIPYIKYSIYDILYIMDRYVIDIIYSFIYGWNPYKLLYSYLLKKLNEVLTNYKISMIFVGFSAGRESHPGRSEAMPLLRNLNRFLFCTIVKATIIPNMTRDDTWRAIILTSLSEINSWFSEIHLP